MQEFVLLEIDEVITWAYPDRWECVLVECLVDLVHEGDPRENPNAPWCGRIKNALIDHAISIELLKELHADQMRKLNGEGLIFCRDINDNARRRCSDA